jgi:hypothetical protein
MREREIIPQKAVWHKHRLRACRARRALRPFDERSRTAANGCYNS